jgi:hypothetical protein
MDPPPPHGTEDGVTLSRVSIKKRFHGALDASATAEMLSAVTEVEGSAAYVAIERVSGKLHGRSGSFVLQHTGTMSRGDGDLKVTVVPDSGTGELKGIDGTMTIDIVEGDHRYTFDYVIQPSD